MLNELQETLGLPIEKQFDGAEEIDSLELNNKEKDELLEMLGTSIEVAVGSVCDNKKQESRVEFRPL